MYLLSIEQSMDSAHFLSEYNGKCSNIHGHRWKIVVTIKEKNLSLDKEKRGMIIDFNVLKEIVKEEVDFFDHSLIVEKDSLKEKTIKALKEENFKIRFINFRPTAECFAKYFYDKIKEKINIIYSVKIYETPNNCAIYTEGENFEL